MKYALILVVVVMLVRIDIVWDLVAKLHGKIPTKKENIEESDITQISDPISFGDDKSLKQSPKVRLIGLMDVFSQRPDLDMKTSILTEFQKSASAFNDILDKELEGAIFHWRSLIQQGNPVVIDLLVELIPQLQGQNQIMARKFFSLVLDQDAVLYLKTYSKTKDLTCTGAMYFADELTPEEQFGEYKERETSLTAASTNDALDSTIKGFATICLAVVKKEIERLAPLMPKPDPQEGSYSEPLATP